MKRLFFVPFLFFLLIFSAYADELDNFVINFNMQIKDDSNFKSDLSVTFGAPQERVEYYYKQVDKPADVYMIFRLSEVTKRPPEQVFEVYKKNRGKGWGVIAMELGVKPGSNEFHLLKEDKIGKHKKEKHKDKGHGKGRDKGKPKD